MAEEEKKENKKTDDEKKNDSSRSSLIGWIITGVIAFVCAAGGYNVSNIFAESQSVDKKKEVSKADTEGIPEKLVNPNLETAETWTYSLEPVVANLNEPGVTRFIRMTVIIELSEKMNQTEGEIFLDEKKIYLRDWLQQYLAEQTLDDVSGGSNQARIKVEIKENFNRILFSESRPLVTKIMLQGYAIQ